MARWRLPVAAVVIVRWCKGLDIMFRVVLYFLGASIIDLDPCCKKKGLAFLKFQRNCDCHETYNRETSISHLHVRFFASLENHFW
jgi:hypothetical protein